LDFFKCKFWCMKSNHYESLIFVFSIPVIYIW
jgi:hypothetical protein